MSIPVQGATLDDLRDLSRRSRRSQRWGFLAAIVALLLFPAQLLLSRWMPPTPVAIAALALGMLPFLRYAYLAGEERGSYRRIFRRLADEKRTRTIVPTDVHRSATVDAHASTPAEAHVRER